MADHVDGILVPTRRKSHAESQPAICVPHVFRFSEQETYNRIAAARAARRFPVTLELLADGSIHLTTVRLLAPHLTTEKSSNGSRGGARQKNARGREDRGRPRAQIGHGGLDPQAPDRAAGASAGCF